MSGISKRELIKQAYPTKSWAVKVNGMSESQVIAVYFRLIRQGKIRA
jgi:hypothetical protein